jgi:hypothetical protein
VIPPKPASADLAGVTDEEWAERNDPNADLIGKSFTYEDGSVYTVTGTKEWSDQYVAGDVHNPETGSTVKNVTKPAGLVRDRLRKDARISDSPGALPGA